MTGPIDGDSDVAAFRRLDRARLLAAREAVDPAVRGAWSLAITDFLTAELERLKPATLGFYWPHRGEYDPMPLIRKTVADGRQVALPVVAVRGQPLEYRAWLPGMAMTAARQSFGIPHPREGPPVLPDALLIPLLGFDDAGYRLGHGGGYFDRTLAAWTHRPVTIGVGFELGRIVTIHPQPHDVPMDTIVTEGGVFRRD